jgi:gliding motility-associated-like protein
LNNAAIANPIATPSATTTYTVTVTENGSCTAPQTATVTLNVAPMPTATIGQNSALCENSGPSPEIVFNGSSATAPYIINYSLNGVVQPPIITIGNSTSINFPTDTPGTYVFSLIDVTESSTNQCSQPQTGTATITIWPNPVVNAGQDIVLCEPGGTSPSDVTLTGTGATTYTWDNSAVNGVAFTPPAGTTLFTVTGTDANGCTDTDEVSVTSLPQPVANGMPSDTYGNVPMVIDFTNLSTYASNYLWDFGNGQSIDTNSLTTVTANFSIPGIYNVILTASNGICTDTWDTIIEVLPPMIVTPPNIFTPNDDSANDQYFVDVKYGEQFEAIILNRWGNLMATLSGINQGWDGKTGGKNCEEGVYFIKYKATDFNGNEVEGHTYFHLIR